MLALFFTLLCSTSGELLGVLRWTHPFRSAGLLLSHGLLTLATAGPLSTLRLGLLLLGYSAVLSVLAPPPSQPLDTDTTRLSDALLAQLLRLVPARAPLTILAWLLLARVLPSLLRPHWAVVYLQQLALLAAASPPVVSLCACLAPSPAHRVNTRTPSRTSTTRTTTCPPPPHHHHLQDPLLHTVHHAHTKGAGGVVLKLRLTLVEHQRWTQEHGWTAELTDEDKATVGGSWTDEAGGAARSPSGFQLPLAGGTTEAARGWMWEERQWTPERGRRFASRWEREPWEVDDDGWTYGDAQWCTFTATPGFRSFTRKRRWTRTACCRPLG